MSTHIKRPSGDFRPDINGLRAIAVVVVVLFHFGVPGFLGGFVGVDIFFVISGFLMTKLIVEKIWKGSFSVLDFYLARARRIFPALATLCLALLLFGALSLPPLTYESLARHATSSLAFISNFAFLNETGYFDVSSSEKWLLHTWSLSVEWQFYLLFPLILVITWKLVSKHNATKVVILGAFFLSLAISIVWTPRNPEAAYFLLPTRAWQMMAGALVYFATPYISPTPTTSRVLELAGIILIGFSVTTFSAAVPWPGYIALVPIIGSMLVILAQNTRSILTTNPVSDFIGTTSYSIYLWHWPIAVALTLRGLNGDWRWIIAGITLTAVLGYISYRLIEVPTRRRRYVNRSSESLAYLSVASVLIGCALLVSYSGGLPNRLGKDAFTYESTTVAIGDWAHPGSNCNRLGTLRYCEKPGTNNRLVMFIGDSIAEQWYPRYGEPEATSGDTVVFITRPGCPPVRNLNGYPPNVNCGQNADAIWKIVRERKPERLVISSNWWATYYLPSGKFRGAACLVTDSDCEKITNVLQLKQAFSSFESDTAEAVKGGAKVFILGSPPSAKIDYVDARLAQLASRHLPFPLNKTWQDLPGLAEGKQSIQAGLAALINANSASPMYTVDMSDNSPQKALLNILQDVAKKSGAQFINPLNFMCPDGLCPLTDQDGEPIYKDAMHLRAKYVRSDELSWLDDSIGMTPHPN